MEKEDIKGVGVALVWFLANTWFWFWIVKDVDKFSSQWWALPGILTGVVITFTGVVAALEWKWK